MGGPEADEDRPWHPAAAAAGSLLAPVARRRQAPSRPGLGPNARGAAQGGEGEGGGAASSPAADPRPRVALGRPRTDGPSPPARPRPVRKGSAGLVWGPVPPPSATAAPVSGCAGRAAGGLARGCPSRQPQQGAPACGGGVPARAAALCRTWSTTWRWGSTIGSQLDRLPAPRLSPRTPFNFGALGCVPADCSVTRKHLKSAAPHDCGTIVLLTPAMIAARCPVDRRRALRTRPGKGPTRFGKWPSGVLAAGTMQFIEMRKNGG